MQIILEVDFNRFFRWLDKVDQAITQNPAAWRAMAIPYYTFVSRNFNRQGYPEKWKPLAPSTLDHRRKGKRKTAAKSAQIGMDTGMMRASVTGPSAAGSVIQFGRDYLLIGSALKRTKWFHAGTERDGRPHQPARPIFTPPDSRTARDMLEAYLRVARRAIP